MKKILFILSFILFISCDCDISKVSQDCVQPENEQLTKDNIQYGIIWSSNNVDVRIITLEKNGIKHDYVVAASHIPNGTGGISIEHWKGCKCNY